MKMISWNVNGIRAAAKKGFWDFFYESDADLFALQETKAHPDQLPEEWQTPLGYRGFFHSAEKKGYSSVAVFSKQAPDSLVIGLGEDQFDREGRVLTLRFGGLSFICAYFPNAQRLGARLPYKLDFCDAILTHCRSEVTAGQDIVLCGDYNIAHQSLDLANPKANEGNAGYLPEERAWMTRFLSQGFRDPFRERHADNGHYTWWSYRSGVREKNIGWRIDYHCINDALADRVQTVAHLPHILGSDHCPILLELR